MPPSVGFLRPFAGRLRVEVDVRVTQNSLRAQCHALAHPGSSQFKSRAWIPALLQQLPCPRGQLHAQRSDSIHLAGAGRLRRAPAPSPVPPSPVCKPLLTVFTPPLFSFFIATHNFYPAPLPCPHLPLPPTPPPPFSLALLDRRGRSRGCSPPVTGAREFSGGSGSSVSCRCTCCCPATMAGVPLVVGAAMHANATFLTSFAECSRQLGSLQGSKLVHGTAQEAI